MHFYGQLNNRSDAYGLKPKLNIETNGILSDNELANLANQIFKLHKSYAVEKTFVSLKRLVQIYHTDIMKVIKLQKGVEVYVLCVRADL